MKLYEVAVVIPPVWSGVYFNTAKLLKYSFEDIGWRCRIVETDDVFPTDLTIVLGWNLIPETVTIESPYIIYQLEPLALDFWREKLRDKLLFFKNASAIWDYTSFNQTYLSAFGLSSTVVKLGYHPKLNETVKAEFADYDVLFVGFLTERRKQLLEELANHCCVSVQPRWGNDFSAALGRSKMLLNIHQYDLPTPLEQPRISYALNNNCFVLSEKCVDYPYHDLIVCPYEAIIKETLHYLHHAKRRNETQHRVVNSFKSEQMKDAIKAALAADKLIAATRVKEF